MVTTVPKCRGNILLVLVNIDLSSNPCVVVHGCFVYIPYIRQDKFVYKVIVTYRLGSCTVWMWFSCVKCYFLLQIRFLNKNIPWILGHPSSKLLQQGNQYVIYVLLPARCCCAEPRVSSGTLWNTVLLIVRAAATYWGHEKQFIRAVQRESMKLGNSAFTVTFYYFTEDCYRFLVS